MKTLWFVAIVVILCSVVAARPRFYKVCHVIPYDPNTMHFGLTPQQAQQRLLRWMNDPSLQIRFVGVGCDFKWKLLNRTTWPVYDPHWHPGWGLSYLFEDNTGKLYVVAIVPIELWEYIDPEVDYPSEDDPTPMLPDEQLRSIALQFVALRVPNLLEGEHGIAPGGGSVYRKVNQVPHNTVAIVYVHPQSGKVKSCFWRNPGEPVGVSTTPNLSSEQASDLALDFAVQQQDVLSAYLLQGTEPHLTLFSDEMGDTRLIWYMRVELELESNAGATASALQDIAVDAHTGDIIKILDYIGRGIAATEKGVTPKRSSKNTPRLRVLKVWLEDTPLQLVLLPPIRIANTAYIWAGWLRSPAVSTNPWRLRYDKGLLVFERGGKQWAVRVGERVMQGVGKPITLSAPVLNRNGRVYLPVESLRVLAGLSVKEEGDRLVLRRQ